MFNKNLNKKRNESKTRILKTDENVDILIPDNFNNTINLELYKNTIINQGSFAKVFKLKTSNNKNIIYKSIISDDENTGIREYRGLKFYYLLQKYLSKNNNDKLKYLCKLHEYGFINKQQDYKNLYAIMDNCGIDLEKYIVELKENNELTLEKIIEIMIECATSLKIIHDSGYCHLDVKPQNFLVVDLGEGRIQIKIIDFGGIYTQDKLINSNGTPIYIAPEILKKSNLKANIKFDIFSLGCLFYTLLEILDKDYDNNIFNKFMTCPLYYFEKENKLEKIISKRYNYKQTLFDKDKEHITKILNDYISKILPNLKSENISSKFKNRYIKNLNNESTNESTRLLSNSHNLQKNEKNEKIEKITQTFILNNKQFKINISDKIILIISKMIDPNINERYDNIVYTINDLNNIFIFNKNLKNRIIPPNTTGN